MDAKAKQLFRPNLAHFRLSCAVKGNVKGQLSEKWRRHGGAKLHRKQELAVKQKTGNRGRSWNLSSSVLVRSRSVLKRGPLLQFWWKWWRKPDPPACCSCQQWHPVKRQGTGFYSSHFVSFKEGAQKSRNCICYHCMVCLISIIIHFRCNSTSYSTYSNNPPIKSRLIRSLQFPIFPKLSSIKVFRQGWEKSPKLPCW